MHTIPYKPDCTLPSDLLEQISEQGFDFLPELIRILVNTAMQVKRQQCLSSQPYERSIEYQGHANGYKPKTIKTRLGDITFAVPQMREGGFLSQRTGKGIAQ